MCQYSEHMYGPLATFANEEKNSIHDITFHEAKTDRLLALEW